MAMHPNQLEIEPETVQDLVADQFPHWRGLAVRPVTSHGTVNKVFRLGERLVLRFPLEPGPPDEKRAWLVAEADLARSLLGRMPVATPVPVALGEPGRGYPLAWAVYGWLPGTDAATASVGHSHQFACDVAAFVQALRRQDTGGRTFDGPGRGGSLSSHDEYVASCLGRSRGLIDVEALARLWGRLRETPRAGAKDVWTHGDLMPGNLLAEDGRLVAVIDVGGLAPADPALDLMPAWNLMEAGPRRAFREALAVDETEWARGQGWALVQAIGCLYYYRVTNPVMSATAHRTLEALLDELEQ
ncbi:aminoglycoside phosphotransferase (APT) family kinase protein [Microlunatus panaciterrae]|uniref:Aminoglycoside phosphotransferase (APT) family kinase protein n=2 Tax=Microlunatus panaciterrae TaxID=400768 RepID=A0ABS2RJG9_9ACTN|nr:aminoglycoside phosphotransferase (APT) family kinase protein [Microlunatus panaciterrae]